MPRADTSPANMLPSSPPPTIMTPARLTSDSLAQVPSTAPPITPMEKFQGTSTHRQKPFRTRNGSPAPTSRPKMLPSLEPDPMPSSSRARELQEVPFGASYANPAGEALPEPTIPPVARPRYFHSRRLKKGETIEKPWLLEKRDPREKWQWILPLVGLVVGLLGGLGVVLDGEMSVPEFLYCRVLDEDFSKGLDGRVWSKEVEVGGFGNGQFEQTTGTDENVFVEDGMLIIRPTLQDPELMTGHAAINLTADGTCTSENNHASNCFTSTNTTTGTVVNPVKSGRINTKRGASIKYGRVEVVAKLPKGDWMWPAIWMLPVHETYGPWPASGEIDITESRGNNYTYPGGGNDIVASTLHWGPDSENDRWWMNNNKKKARLGSWGDGFHVYGIEWTEKHLFTFINNRLLTVMYSKFDTSFWRKGKFSNRDTNGTMYIDPWSQTTRASTPFDQDFYLVLNVAVGGTNGWFEDGVGAKPWVDASPHAKRDFWNARERWYPSWEKGGQMEVRKVTMWQQRGYNGCVGGNWTWW